MMVTLIAFRLSKAGRKAVRISRRFTTWLGPVIASLIRPPARCPRSAAQWTLRKLVTKLHRRGGIEERSGPIRSSIRASTPFTILVLFRFRLRAGAPMTQLNFTSRHRAESMLACRSARGLRRFGSLPRRRRRREQNTGRLWQTSRSKGATALGDAELKAVVVGKTLKDSQCRVTGQRIRNHLRDRRPAHNYQRGRKAAVRRRDVQTLCTVARIPADTKSRMVTL